MAIPQEPQRYWDDLRWAREHSAELYRRFGADSPEDGNIWIAIFNQEVVAAGPNLAEVERIAAEKTDRPPEEIPVKFIASAAAIYDQIAF